MAAPIVVGAVAHFEASPAIYLISEIQLVV